MIRKRLGQLATAVTTAALLGALVVAAPVSAQTPGWTILNLQKLPPVVADGGVAGYSFTIKNGGKSNISALYLTDTYVGVPVYLSNSRGTTCQLSPDLRCAFGALNAGATIDVVIAYTVGTTDFSDTFKLDSTGDPAGGNNSHGDSFLKSVTTTVSTNPNFDGGFTTSSSQVLSTNQTLGNGNKQSTSLVSPASLIPATIEDGITTGVPCSISQCTHLIGEWSNLSVNGGATYGIAFKVTIMVWGGAVPGGVTAADIFVLHTRDNGTTYPITTACNSATAPTNAECITVTKVGNNFKIVAWLFSNGNLRGGY
ncbi:MAG: hypothetical protein HYX55_03430 [Chloroflexi bacterium]|nr:hypothetical protein [Chloroflexota bacterium]